MLDAVDLAFLVVTMVVYGAATYLGARAFGTKRPPVAPQARPTALNINELTPEEVRLMLDQLGLDQQPDAPGVVEEVKTWSIGPGPASHIVFLENGVVDLEQHALWQYMLADPRALVEVDDRTMFPISGNSPTLGGGREKPSDG